MKRPGGKARNQRIAPNNNNSNSGIKKPLQNNKQSTTITTTTTATQQQQSTTTTTTTTNTQQPHNYKNNKPTTTQVLTTNSSINEPSSSSISSSSSSDYFEEVEDLIMQVTYVGNRKNKKSQKNGEVDGYVLQPGLVVIRKFLSIKQQKELQKAIWEMGKRREPTGAENEDIRGGFYRPYAAKDSEAKFNLQMMCIGKHWNPLDRVYEHKRSDCDNLPVWPLPESFKTYCLNALHEAQKLSPCLPDMNPTACIINFYNESGKLGLHRDRTEKEETIKKGIPVVSLSIGDSGDFMYIQDREQKTITLESGDALVFGGPSRLISHAVTLIHPHTSPIPPMAGGIFKQGRLNLTFREDGWD